MEIGKGKLCRLCLQTLIGTNCENIGEITKEMLDILLLTPDLNVTEEHAICSSCMENLQNSFNFKATCFYTDDYIFPFLRSDSTTKLDLRVVIMDLNENMKALNISVGISADEGICRLCLNLVTDECFTDLHEVKDMLTKCIPELDFDSTTEPVICNDCFESLKRYFRFMENCLDTEEQIKKFCNLKKNRGKVILRRVAEFMQAVGHDGSLNIAENQENCLAPKGDIQSNNWKSDRNTTLRKKLKKSENSVEKVDQMITQANNDITELKLYNCANCSFQTMYRQNLKKHMILHKNPSEIQWFKCELCPYKEKFERYLKTHMEIHKKNNVKKVNDQKQMSLTQATNNDSVDLNLYKCESCSYQTNNRGYLRRHESRKHKDPLEGFKCTLCSFKAKRKVHLKFHMGAQHNKEEKTQPIFKCDKCMYQSNYKANVKKHAQTHGDSATLKMHSCDVCSYKSWRKSDVKDHMRKHGNQKMLTCEKCTFKTKYKESLTRHMMKHKDLSELAKYKCEVCAFETTYKIILSKHILRLHMDHSKLEKHKCKKCDYTSVFKSNVGSHMKYKHKKKA